MLLVSGLHSSKSASNSRANRGRNQEVSGECPFLAGEVAFAFVTNLQKEGDQKHLKTVSTPKHFLAYDLEGHNAQASPVGASGGESCTACCDIDAVHKACNVSRFNFNAEVSHQDLVSFYLPSWEAAVKRANAHSVMCSFNAVNVSHDIAVVTVASFGKVTATLSLAGPTGLFQQPHGERRPSRRVRL